MKSNLFVFFALFGYYTHFTLADLVGVVGGLLENTANLSYPISSNPNDVKFFLYPSPGVEKEIVYNNATSLANSGFNYQKQTVILIHGFTDDRKVHLDAVVLPAYLNSNLNYNYIVVDWGSLSANATFSNPLEQFVMYEKVVQQSIYIVGNRTLKFLTFLNLDPDTTHVIGHSLGAHVGGLVGALYQALNGKKLARITGLDPAGPLFLLSFPFPKLNKANANFVDIIHTNAGMAGVTSTDGGINQPGCNLETDGTDACSHQFVTFIYAASITKNIYACPQWNSTDPITGLTNGLTGLNDCPTDKVLVGENCPSSIRGLYYFTTTSTP